MGTGEKEWQKNTYIDLEMSNDDIVADIRVQVTFDFFSRTQQCCLTGFRIIQDINEENNTHKHYYLVVKWRQEVFFVSFNVTYQRQRFPPGRTDTFIYAYI